MARDATDASDDSPADPPVSDVVVVGGGVAGPTVAVSPRAPASTRSS